MAAPNQSRSLSTTQNTSDCPVCKGLGWLRSNALPGDTDFGKLVECPCGNVARERLARLDTTFGFSEQLRTLSFDSLKDIAGMAAAIKAIKAYITDPRGWLYLHGPYGDGKTTLLAVAMNKLRQRGYEAVFCVVPELLDYLRATFRPETGEDFDSTFERIRNVPVLGLDDLATEKASAWADEKLYELIGWRYRMELPTVVTSNKAPSELRDARLASRFSDVKLGNVVFCGPHDVRKIKR